MNRYNMYPGDYMRDTADLSGVEDGMYLRLLNVYYSTESRIRDDAKFRVARAFSRSEREATQRVLDRFFILDQSGTEPVWIHERAEREIRKAQPKIEAAKRNGRKGGRPPSEKPNGLADGIANAEPRENLTQNLPPPSPPPNSPSESDPPVVPQGDKPKRRKPSVPLPDDWAPTEAHRERAAKAGLNLEREAERFRNHAASKDRRAANWNAAFANWLSNAEGYQPNGSARPQTRQPEDPNFDFNRYVSND